MKLITLVLSVLFSLSALGSVHKLSFQAPDFTVKKVVLAKPFQTNLIRLYQRLPSERRMIAGLMETRIKVVSQTSYLDGLREKLKSTNGKIRL